MPLISGQKPATWTMLACSCIPSLFVQKTNPNKQTVNKPLVKLTLLTQSRENTACSPPVKLFLAGTMLNTWHLMVEIWLPLMPNLSGEHQGCCVLAMAKRAFLRFIELHYEGMNCYKFSAWNKARLMAATLYTTRSNLPLVLPVCTLPQLCVINKCPSPFNHSSFFEFGGVGWLPID